MLEEQHDTYHYDKIWTSTTVIYNLFTTCTNDPVTKSLRQDKGYDTKQSGIASH